MPGASVRRGETEQEVALTLRRLAGLVVGSADPLRERVTQREGPLWVHHCEDTAWAPGLGWSKWKFTNHAERKRGQVPGGKRKTWERYLRTLHCLNLKT